MVNGYNLIIWVFLFHNWNNWYKQSSFDNVPHQVAIKVVITFKASFAWVRKYTGLYFQLVSSHPNWQMQAWMQFRPVKAGHSSIFKTLAWGLVMYLFYMRWEGWQYLRSVLKNVRQSANFRLHWWGYIRCCMDFYSRSSAHPSVTHSAHMHMVQERCIFLCCN